MVFLGIAAVAGPPSSSAPAARTSRKRTWEQRSDPIESRTDNLALARWIDTHDAYAYYDQCNVTIDVPTYTDADYDARLKHKEWSKEETDHLFDLCRRYDLRFPVIVDRYNDGRHATTRTLEMLQQRYYDVTRRLRPQSAFVFPYEEERQRREQLTSLYHRPKAEIELEMAHAIHLRRMQASLAEDAARREHLLRLFNKGEFAFHAAFPKADEEETTSQTGLSRYGSRIGSQASLSEMHSSHHDLAAATLSQSQSQSQLIKDTHGGAGVYLRSHRLLSALNTRITHEQKVRLERELVHALHLPGIPYMCTEKICQEYETLRNMLLELIDLYDTSVICDDEG